MNVIYLAAYEAYHHEFKVTYQDINGKRDIDGDMMDINLDPFDVIVATPPCNYWSRAHSTDERRNNSPYSVQTMYLLPGILLRLKTLNKPFIVENVRNYPLFSRWGLFEIPGIFTYEHGRHTYWTNILFNPSALPKYNNGYHPIKEDGSKGGYIRFKGNDQGGLEVHNVINYWLELVKQIIQAEE